MAPGQTRADLVRQVPAEDWSRLASMRIVFGHQSVGFNILEGVADVAKEVPAVRLKVVESATPSASGEVGLLHFQAGKNSYPMVKVDDFVRFVDASGENAPDIAFLKFCYVDIVADTDTRAVFEHYRTAFAGLQSRHPRTTFVHLTMPLTWVSVPALQTAKNIVKKIMGRQVDDHEGANARRHEYNELLRAEYGGKAPVFDLAEIESTRADGSRVLLTAGGKTFYALAPEYTTDGGHLNEVGRRIVAERLLVTLAEIAKRRASGN